MTGPSDAGQRQRIKDNGLESLRRIHGDHTWEDWTAVIAAFELINEEAMSAVKATAWDKDNKTLVKEFNRRWDAYESGVGSNHKPLSKQERWAVRDVMGNPAITAWRAGLTGPEKRRLNHPNAVINRWKAREKKKAIPAEDKPPSAYKKMEMTNVKLQEELHQLKKNGDGNQFTKDSKAKDVAIAIIGAFEALPSRVSKIEGIISELRAWVKAQPKQTPPKKAKVRS